MEAERIARIMLKNKYMHPYGAPHRWHTRNTYKLSRREVLRLLILQRGNCHNCDKDLDTVKRWYIDHDHATGRLRGIACPSCNALLRE